MKTHRVFVSALLMAVAIVVAAACSKPDDGGGNGDNSGNNGSGGNNGGNSQQPSLAKVTTKPVNNIAMYSASSGGMVSDDGGSAVKERGVCWSTSEKPTVDDTHRSSGIGTGLFTIDMDGLSPGTTYYVRAYAVNEAGTSYGDADRFTTVPYIPSTYPNGILPGVFSVSYSKKVRFSQGNMQYIGGVTSYWRFADYQWEHLGNNGQASSYYSTRDLFAWGTSGWDCGNTYYKPNEFDESEQDPSLFGPPGTNSLTGSYANSDWGVYNAIVNGGNRPNQWRTPNKNEWNYIFKTRSASTVNGVNNARYMLAIVNDVFGVILFPDTYNHPSGVTLPKKQNINMTKITTNNFNTYDGSNWLQMEEAGCVFLPITGWLIKSGVERYDWEGMYWTSSCSTDARWGITFGFDDYRTTILGGEVFFDEIGGKDVGCAVRLVQDY